MTALIYAVIAAVAMQRLAEVAYANSNTRALRARGAVEVGGAHYPLMVALHSLWLLAIVVMLPTPREFYVVPFAIFIALQFARLWVLKTLGPWWTTRILTLPDAPLIRSGPYRYLRHPNYWIVACEIPALPLVFGEWRVALVFMVLNAAMLAWRIRTEEAAIGPRRML